MKYNDYIKVPSKSTKRLAIGNFLSGFNTRLDESVLKFEVAKNIENFSFSSGVLTHGYGLASVALNVAEIVSAWEYKRWNYEKNERESILMYLNKSGRVMYSMDGGIVFNVVENAVCLAFFKELIALFKPPFKTIGLIIVASIPAVISGVVFSLLDITAFEGAKYLCFFFFISAALMLACELISKRKTQTHEINLKTAICMGLMQSVAVLPGITRSGSTIFGGIAEGGERNKVAKFSFFMSIPIIIGAAAFDLISGGDGESVKAYCYIIGMVTAFISGFLAIRFMLKLIAKANFKWFALYLFVLSIVTFFIYFL